MNCPEVKDLLSSYYDGELGDELRTQVSQHLQRCADCQCDLQSFEKLSQIAGALTDPVPPDQLWSRIESQLDHGQTTAPLAVRSLDVKTKKVDTRRWSWLAATLLITATIGLFAYSLLSPHSEHHEFMAVFGEYLEHFQTDPGSAQDFLLATYESHRVSPEEAIDRVGYRPVVADGLPPGYTMTTTHVMKMPCCTCVQCLCQRPDGTSLAVFEHNDDELHWFGDRPAIQVICQSKQCSLVELPDSIAASWQHGKRQITVIGARDVKEIDDLVAWFNQSAEARSYEGTPEQLRQCRTGPTCFAPETSAVESEHRIGSRTGDARLSSGRACQSRLSIR